MHVYLPEKCRSPFFMEFPFLHGVLIFSKVWVSDSKLRWLFSLLLTQVISCDIDPWKDLISSYFFVLRPFISRVANFAQWFLRKGILEPALLGVFGCPPTWSCPQVFKSGLGMRLYEGRFGYLQGVVFMQNFWNFKAIPDTEIILTLIQSKLILQKFKWFLWRGFQKWWKLFVLIFGEKYKVTFGWSQKGLNFNLRVNENRVSTKMWRTRSDIWLVTKRFKFQFEG